MKGDRDVVSGNKTGRRGIKNVHHVENKSSGPEKQFG